MRIVFFRVLTLAFIVYSIECSSLIEGNPYNKRNPGPSHSFSGDEQNSPDRTARERTPIRVRSRSPASKSPSMKVLGYTLEQLGYIRLIPRTNEGLRFEFRKFYFPQSISIRFRTERKYYSPVSNLEYIALSTSNREIHAILDYGGFLRGMYRKSFNHSRVKINMLSNEFDDMTTDQIRNCPVGRNHPIFPQSFSKTYVDFNSLQSEQNHDIQPNSCYSSPARQHSPRQTFREESPSRSRPMSPPGRPPSDQALGFPIEQLGYLRLIPYTNQKQQFEFRSYVFPVDKPIRMRIDRRTYVFDETRKYIVLSTSMADIYAILDQTQTLRGIHRTDKVQTRVKMNIISGAVINLTPDEMRDCPVGKNHPIIPNGFIVAFAKDDSLQFQWTPHAQMNAGPPSSAEKHLGEQTHPQEAHPQARSKSPPGRPPSHEVLGRSLEELGYIRLIPRANRNQKFEFRRYFVSSNGSIRLQSGHNIYIPVPPREYIVLSTSNGDVFAILEYTGVLRGIYSTKTGRPRIKMNMRSGAVEKMTTIEMKECHVGNSYAISPRWFDEVVSNEDSLRYVYY